MSNAARDFLLWLLKVTALLGVLAFCLWLSLRPKNPNFTIVEFTVPSLSNNQNSSSGNDEKNYEDGTISYTLEISNSNKDSSVSYDDVLLVFYFGRDSVGRNTIPAFKQGKGDKIQKSNHVDASEQKVGKAIRDAILKGKADLKVDLVTKIRFTTWGVKSKHHGVNLEAKIPVGSDGKLSSKKKKIELKKPSTKWKLRANKFL